MSKGRLLLGATLLIPALWMFLGWKAHGHYRTGKERQTEGRLLEAGREYQTAIGFYAPLNPWSKAAAEALRELARKSRGEDPSLAFELEDRLRRSVRGVRWLVQPYGEFLDDPGTSPEKQMRDPDPWLFLLSMAGLAGGFGALLVPRRGALFRVGVFAAGLAVWALALRFC